MHISFNGWVLLVCVLGLLNFAEVESGQGGDLEIPQLDPIALI